MVAIFLAAFTHYNVAESQNTLSRFVAVESLVVRGVSHIDDSAYGPAWTETVRTNGETMELHRLNDMAYNKRDGHFYSSKPPVLTLMLAAVLWPVRGWVAGLEFSPRGMQQVVFFMTWVVVGWFTALSFGVFRRKVGEALGGIEGDVLTALTLGGTLFVTYSVTMNHHTLTAGLALMSLFLLGMVDIKDAPKQTVSAGPVLLAGFLMGLASVIDIGPGVAFVIAIGLYMVLRRRSWRALLLFALGSIPPLAVHCAVQYGIWGTVLPVQMIGATRSFPGNYWSHPGPPDSWHLSRSYYWLLTLMSGRGLLVLSPILLVGVAALADDVARSLRQGRTGPGWLGLAKAGGAAASEGYAALSVLFAIVFLVLYTSFSAPTNFNGSCYGMRYYIGFMPVLAFYAARGFVRWKDSKRFRVRFYALGLISMFFALAGMEHPWLLMENNLNPVVQVLMLALRGFSA